MGKSLSGLVVGGFGKNGSGYVASCALKRLGYDLIMTSDATAVVDILRRNQLDVVVADIKYFDDAARVARFQRALGLLLPRAFLVFFGADEEVSGAWATITKSEPTEEDFIAALSL